MANSILPPTPTLTLVAIPWTLRPSTTGSKATFHCDHPSSAVRSALPMSMPARLRSDRTVVRASSLDGRPAGRAGAGMSHGAKDGHDAPGAHGGTAHPMATLPLPEP